MSALPFAEVLLERLKVGVAQAIAPELAEDMLVHEVAADALDGKLLYVFTSFVLAHHRVEARRTVHFQAPATWWQHAKLALRSRAWRRWPRFLRYRLQSLQVEYRRERVEVVFTEHELLPQAPIRWPKNFGQTFIRQEIREERDA